MNVVTVDNSQRLLDAMRAKLVPAVQAGALLIENDAKLNSPVRTGTLRRSIHTDVDQESEDRVSARVSPGVDYGVYVEMGTRKMAAHPYLRPAFESQKDAAIEEVKNALAEMLR